MVVAIEQGLCRVEFSLAHQRACPTQQIARVAETRVLAELPDPGWQAGKTERVFAPEAVDPHTCLGGQVLRARHCRQAPLRRSRGTCQERSQFAQHAVMMGRWPVDAAAPGAAHKIALRGK